MGAGELQKMTDTRKERNRVAKDDGHSEPAALRVRAVSGSTASTVAAGGGGARRGGGGGGGGGGGVA